MSSSKIMNESLCKQLVAAYFREVRAGHKPSTIIRQLLNEVYAHGVAVGELRAKQAPPQR